MSSEERKDINNAIWLCQNCHKAVDDDHQRYTVTLLRQWKDDIEHLARRAIIEPSTNGPSEAAAVVDEIVVLGDNNAFLGTEDDLKALAMRCAIRAIEGSRTRFSVRLRETVLASSETEHPLARPLYEKARRRNAEPLKDCLEILASPEVYGWWSCWLCDIPEWQLAIKSLLESATLRPAYNFGHKVDVWRTDAPQLSAPIYLSDAEIAELLKRHNLTHMQEMALGPGAWSAMDLPHDVIVKHVLPSIVHKLVGRDLQAEGHALNLLHWHMGNG